MLTIIWVNLFAGGAFKASWKLPPCDKNTKWTNTVGKISLIDLFKHRVAMNLQSVEEKCSICEASYNKVCLYLPWLLESEANIVSSGFAQVPHRVIARSWSWVLKSCQRGLMQLTPPASPPEPGDSSPASPDEDWLPFSATLRQNPSVASLRWGPLTVIRKTSLSSWLSSPLSSCGLLRGSPPPPEIQGPPSKLPVEPQEAALVRPEAQEQVNRPPTPNLLRVCSLGGKWLHGIRPSHPRKKIVLKFSLNAYWFFFIHFVD